jgi:UDPglucose--hexose-1-phosphate uridylyltransferase
VVRTTLLRLFEGLDDPDYNMVIRSVSPYRSRSEYIHWYLSIVPRVAQTAGFELGSGMYVNTTVPEEVAAFLRDVTVS